MLYLWMQNISTNQIRIFHKSFSIKVNKILPLSIQLNIFERMERCFQNYKSIHNLNKFMHEKMWIQDYSSQSMAKKTMNNVGSNFVWWRTRLNCVVHMIMEGGTIFLTFFNFCNQLHRFPTLKVCLIGLHKFSIYLFVYLCFCELFMLATIITVIP